MNAGKLELGLPVSNQFRHACNGASFIMWFYL